jgi:hypothetical protein
LLKKPKSSVLLVSLPVPARWLGVVGERDREREGRLAERARTVVVVVEVVVRVRRLGRGGRGNLQASESADSREVAGVDAHDVVAGRQPEEGVVAVARG